MAKSHPTYDKSNMKKAEALQSVIVHDEQWRAQASEELASKYGRGWWLFQGTPIRSNRRKTWIEQYNKEGESTRASKK